LRLPEGPDAQNPLRMIAMSRMAGGPLPMRERLTLRPTMLLERPMPVLLWPMVTLMHPMPLAERPAMLLKHPTVLRQRPHALELRERQIAV
jgi:hypothetical protein